MSKTQKAGKAFKEMLEESPEMVQKVIRALKGESDDAVSKLGSGKNLKALTEAKADLPDIPTSKAYPKNITQDALADIPASRTKDFSMVPEGSQVPAVRPEALVPDVMPKTPDMGMGQAPQFDINSSVLSKVDDVPNPFKVGQAAPESMGNIAESMKGQLDNVLDPNAGLKKKLALGAAGLGGAAGLSMLGDDQQKAEAMPLLPMVAAAATPAVVNNLMNPAPKQPELPRSPAVEKSPVAPPEPPVDDPQSAYLSDLDAAQKRQKELDFIDNMLRAGITGGAALSRTKADYGNVDALQKQNGKGVQNVKDKMAADHDDKKLKKEQQDLNDGKILRDPKSDVSKAFRSALVKLGIPHSDKTTASDAKAMGINIQNLLMQDRALAAAKDKADTKGGEKDDKMIQSFRKELTTGVLGKQFEAFSTAQRTNDMVKEFAKNPTGYSDYGTLMNSLKTLQGDASTVREAEMKLGMESGSLANKYQNVWSKAKNGQSLQPSQRQDIINATKILTEIAQKNYLKSAAPVLAQAKRLNFEEHELLHGGLTTNIEGDKSAEQAASSPVYSASQQKAIELVMQKNNVDQATAINALKKAGKL